MSEPDPKAIFQEAHELPAAERGGFLDRSCGGDPALRARVEALLAAEQAAGAFLASPTGGAGAGLVPPELPGTVIGRFRLQQQIGEGGFGTVWMAEQQQPVRRQVALKVVKRGMDTRTVVARFEQERQALAMMDHPNIAKVLDGGETPAGRPSFAMELVRGVPITQFCDQEHFDAQQRLGLFVQVCHAVQHAHQKGIIHRDLKPSNVLVTLHDGAPVPKVIDFGIAKAVHRPLTDKTLFTEFQQMVGTPEYMSPEQAELSGLDIDTRADIYSLGVLLYELLTGTLPFDARMLAQMGLLEMLRVIREDEPPKPSTRISSLGEIGAAVAKQRRTDSRRLLRQLRGDLDWITMKALEKDRGRRYVSADALAADIQRHLQHEPVQASPPGRVYRLRKYVRRHRVVVTAGALVAAALLAGLSAAVWGLVTASEQRDRAVLAKDVANEQTKIATAAKERAVVGEAAARKAAARASTVVHLFDKMLGAADPQQYKGRDYRVRDLLDDFDRELGSSLQSEPEVDATVRRLLGNAYRGLGLLDKAEQYLDQALTITQEPPAADSMEAAESLQAHAFLLHDLGRYREAVLEMKEAKRLFEARGSPAEQLADCACGLSAFLQILGDLDGAEQHAVAAVTLSGGDQQEPQPGIDEALARLAHVRVDQDRLTEAEELALRALAATQQLHGERSLAHARYLASLATVLEARGDAEGAEAALRDELEIEREQLGRHSTVAVTLDSLGNQLRVRGRLQDCDAALAEAYEILGGSPDAVSYGMAQVLTSMSFLRQDQGDPRRAESTSREALGVWVALLGETNVNTLIARGNLAVMLHERGQVGEAATLMQQCLEQSRQAFGTHNTHVASCLNNLGMMRRDLGDLGEAAALLQQALDLERQLAPNHPKVGISLHNLGTVLERQGKLVDAESCYREGLENLHSALGDDALATASCALCAAGLLQKLGRHAEAEPLLQQAIAGFRASGAEDQPEFDVCQRLLAEGLFDQRRFAEAAEVREQTLVSRRHRFGQDSLPVARCLTELAEARRLEGVTAAADEALAQALAITAVQPSVDSDEWLVLANNQAMALQRLGRNREAAALGQRALAMAEALQDEAKVALLRSNLGGVLNNLTRFADAEKLLRAALVVNARVNGESEIALKTTHDLATALMFQGSFAEAEELYHRVLEVRKRRLGGTDPLVDSELSSLAYLLSRAGKPAAAEPVLEELLASRERLGAEHVDVAETLVDLARARYLQRRSGAGEEALQRSLAIARSEQQPDSDRLATVSNGQAHLLMDLGRFAEAIEPQQRAIDVTVRFAGEQHDNLPRLRAELALQLNTTGKPDAAVALFRAACPQLEQQRGAEDPVVIEHWYNFAVALQMLGQLDEAEVQCRKVLELRRKVQGEAHPRVASTVGTLTDLLLKQRKHAEAEATAREAVVLLQQLGGGDDTETEARTMALANVLRAVGKLDEAEVPASRALASRRSRLPPGDAEIGSSLAQLARLLVEQGKYADAEPLARECLGIRAEKMPGTWRHAVAMSLLGGALAGLGKHEAADPLLSEGYAKMPPAPALAELRREALLRLVRHYEAWGKPELATKWRQVLEDGGGR